MAACVVVLVVFLALLTVADLLPVLAGPAALPDDPRQGEPGPRP